MEKKSQVAHGRIVTKREQSESDEHMLGGKTLHWSRGGRGDLPRRVLNVPPLAEGGRHRPRSQRSHES